MKMILRASIIMLIHRLPDQTYWLQDKQDGLGFFFAYPPLICQPNKLSKRSENLGRLFCSNLIANLRYKWLTLKLEFRRGKDMNPAAICTDFLKLRWSKKQKKKSTKVVKFGLWFMYVLRTHTSHCFILCSVISPKTKKHIAKRKI